MADVTPINVQIPRLTPKPSGIITGAKVGAGALSGAKIGSAFGPVGSLVGAAISALGTLGVQALQNRYNRKQTDKAWNRNLQQWNAENEYSSPQMQMERLRAAGLSPNLMYANGSAGGVSASSPNAEYSNSTELDPHFFDKIISLIGIRNQTNQTNSVIDLQESQRVLNSINTLKSQADINAIKAQTLNEITKGVGYAQDNLTKAVEYADKKFNLGLAKKLAPYQISSAMWQNELIKYNMLQADIGIEKWMAEAEGAKLNNQLLGRNIENAGMDYFLKEKQGELYQEQIRDAYLHNRAYQLGTQWLPDDIAFGRWHGRYSDYNQAYWGSFGSRLLNKTPIKLKYDNITYSKSRSFKNY